MSEGPPVDDEDEPGEDEDETREDILYKVTLPPEFQTLYEEAARGDTGRLIRAMRGDEEAAVEEELPTNLEGITAVEMGYLITFFAYRGMSMEDILLNLRYERTTHPQPCRPKYTIRSPEERPQLPKER